MEKSMKKTSKSSVTTRTTEAAVRRRRRRRNKRKAHRNSSSSRRRRRICSNRISRQSGKRQSSVFDSSSSSLHTTITPTTTTANLRMIEDEEDGSREETLAISEEETQDFNDDRECYTVCCCCCRCYCSTNSRAQEMRLRLSGSGSGSIDGSLMMRHENNQQPIESPCMSFLVTSSKSNNDELEGEKLNKDNRSRVELESYFKQQSNNWPMNNRKERREDEKKPIISSNLKLITGRNKRITIRQYFNHKVSSNNETQFENEEENESRRLLIGLGEKEDLPMKKAQDFHHYHLLSFRESFSNSLTFLIKLFILSHIIHSLVSLNTKRSQQNQFEPHDGHLSVRWLEPNRKYAIESTVSNRFWPQLFVLAIEEDNSPFLRNEEPADDWLAINVNEDVVKSQPEVDPNKQSMSADRLLLYETSATKSETPEQLTQNTPLDIIKHNKHHKHRPHHHHHHHNHHHAHHRKHIHKPEVEEPEVEKSIRSGQRVRRHGGFYDGAADRPVVASRKGLVRGITQKLFTGKFVDAFLGIPYAKPPIGNYRFRHPQPTDSWMGELDASRLPNSCYQVNDTFFGANFGGTVIWNANTPLSEDCLYLNIWTPFGVANTTVPSTPNKVYRPPAPTEQSKASKRPVLVWIFGGGFYYGTSTLALYEGGLLASEEDILVVSINYRVSALGFLYLGRPDAPGNAGLFDQLLALQWIQDNIDQFGGDPSRVTIFGESAGAVSAAFHLLSPLSRNLFSQAILQSGAATCPWGCMEPREIMNNGLKLATQLNCPSNASDLDSVVDCLVKTDPMTMVLMAQDVNPDIGLLNFPFVPVVDGSFLLESPSESLIKSNFKRARILLGSNYDEGSAYLIYLTEFNHCPGDAGGSSNDNGVVDNNNNNNNNNNNKPPTQLTSKPTQQHSIVESPQNQYPSVAPTSPDPNPFFGSGGGELRDQGMESMEMIAAAARQQLPAANLLSAAPSLNPATAAEAEPEGGLGGGGRSTQHNLPPNYSDSNPCKPNDSPSLTRDGFLKTLNKHLNPYAEHPIGKEAIVFEYSNWINTQDSVSNYDALDKIVGDFHFTCHVNEFAQRYASAGNAVYMYYFKQRSSVSQWPKWMGVMHGDEIAFVFGEPLNQMLNYTNKEVELSRRMMRYWANFAKTGNPTKMSENSSLPEKWPEYSNNRQYFELSGDLIRIGRGPRAKQCAFWAHYLPKLIDSYDRNQCPASSAATNHMSSSSHSQYRCPPMYHPLDPSFSANQRDIGLLNNLPSLVIVSLSVILVLSIIGLLVYAKRTERRWRNQRAMNQQQHQQQQQQQQPVVTTTNTTAQVATSSLATGSNLTPEVEANSATGAGRQQQQQAGSGGMQLHNLRPISGQFQTTVGAGMKPAASAGFGTSATEQPNTAEQSALDMAQSAAARVTGSAAAAIAAARFKMLRSNTLAAAFGLPASGSESNAPEAATATAPVNMLAMRTKDDRVVNTLSLGSNARNNKLN